MTRSWLAAGIVSATAASVVVVSSMAAQVTPDHKLVAPLVAADNVIGTQPTATATTAVPTPTATEPVATDTAVTTATATPTLTATPAASPTPTASATPTPTPPPCVTEPQAVIDVVTDGLGNSNSNSWAQGTGGDWTGDVNDSPVIEVGTTINVTVAASSDCPLQYRFQRQRPGGSFELLRDWSSSNTFRYTFVNADFGQWTYIIPEVRDTDPRNRFGDKDDYNYLSYEVE